MLGSRWPGITVSIFLLFIHVILEVGFKSLFLVCKMDAFIVSTVEWGGGQWFHLTHASMLLLLLSHFNRVWLCVTPETAAYQASQSLGLSRQEHWSGLHFLLQCMKVKIESEVAQSCLTVSNPMDCSPPGFSVHGIFQATVTRVGCHCLLWHASIAEKNFAVSFQEGNLQ